MLLFEKLSFGIKNKYNIYWNFKLLLQKTSYFYVLRRRAGVNIYIFFYKQFNNY